MLRAAAVLSLALGITAHGQQHTQMYVFSADADEVPHATTVPQPVQEVVVEDIRKTWLKDYEGDPGPVSRWTSGTEIPSRVPRRRLFVLMGIGPVRGANTTLFWIAELSAEHKARILKRIQALSFTVHYMQGESYPRLTAESVIAQSVWRCDVRWSHDRYVEAPDCSR